MEGSDREVYSRAVIVGRDEQLVALASALEHPGLSVVTGGPGAGKTALVRHAAHRAGRQVLEAGALSSLRAVPALPLSRAVRAAVPVDDPSLAVEAVRVRLGDAVLLLDDAHWADRFTLGLLPELSRRCRVIATLRRPGPLTDGALAALRQTAAVWIDLPPLSADDAAAVVREVRADLTDAEVAGIVGRSGGNPLALRVLAAAGAGEPAADALRGVAEMVADLPQDERTALAALGLLGRPAPATLLGPGGPALVRRGIAVADPHGVTPVERFVAEVAAGVLPAEQRRRMHCRLAELVTDAGEAARHLAAAGDDAAAADRALAAARVAGTPLGARAEQYLFAVSCLKNTAPADVVLEAAEAALDVGLAADARRLVEPLAPPDPTGRIRRAVVLAQALTQTAAQGATGTAAEVLQAVAAELPGADLALRGRHAVAAVYAALVEDPDVACALAEYPLAELGPAAPPQLRAAYGAALLTAGRPGWQEPVRAAMDAARTAGDLAAECAAGAILVAGLRDGLRTADAGAAALELAEHCAAQGAYSFEVSFRAEALWASLHTDGVTDDLLRLTGTLLDRSAPASARALLVATAALAQADSGSVPAARALLRDGATRGDRLASWVAAETGWLDGDLAGTSRALAELLGPRAGADAAAPGLHHDAVDLAADLARLTWPWCAEGPRGGVGAGDSDRSAVGATLAAWASPSPAAFADAARAWTGVMVRERVRCLIAAGESAGEVDLLLDAEKTAQEHGLVLLLGRVRRALRQRGVTRRAVTQERPAGLSPREFEALALVGQGHSTRRIAELLGLTRNTTETYIKQAMAKLGARTRTEAAVRASALAAAGGADSLGAAEPLDTGRGTGAEW